MNIHQDWLKAAMTNAATRGDNYARRRLAAYRLRDLMQDLGYDVEFDQVQVFEGESTFIIRNLHHCLSAHDFARITESLAADPRGVKFSHKVRQVSMVNLAVWRVDVKGIGVDDLLPE